MLNVQVVPRIFFTGGQYHAVILSKNFSFSLSATGKTEEDAVKNLQLLIDRENEEALEHNHSRGGVIKWI